MWRTQEITILDSDLRSQLQIYKTTRHLLYYVKKFSVFCTFCFHTVRSSLTFFFQTQHRIKGYKLSFLRNSCSVSGRRFTLLTCSLLTSILLFVSVFSPDYILFFIFRFVTGLFFSGLYVTYTYASEVVSTHYRTRASLFLFLSQATGAYLGAFVAMLIIPNENLGWEYYQVFISTLFFLSFILLLFVPETPRFLLTSGNCTQALAVIQRFNSDCNLLVTLRPVISQDRGSLRVLINDASCVKTLLGMMIVTSMVRLDKYAVGLLFLENLQNPNAENCVLVSRYHHVNIGCGRLSTKDYELYVIMSCSNLIAALLSKSMADLFGRRKTLLIFGFLTVIQLSIFFFCKPDLVHTFLALSTRSLITTSQMISFVCINELFPTSLRGLCYGICLSASEAAISLAPMLVQYLSKISYSAALSSLIFSALIWAVVMIFFKQETKDVAQSDSVGESERKVDRIR